MKLRRPYFFICYPDRHARPAFAQKTNSNKQAYFLAIKENHKADTLKLEFVKENDTCE